MKRKKAERSQSFYEGHLFVRFYYDVLNGKAFCKLPASAAKALLFFMAKPEDGDRKKISYGDPVCFRTPFELSYLEGKRYGFAFSTFAKVIRDLVGFGFLDPIDKGGLRGDCKSYNRFQLSRRWEKYGRSDFEAVDWRCFIPKER